MIQPPKREPEELEVTLKALFLLLIPFALIWLCAALPYFAKAIREKPETLIAFAVLVALAAIGTRIAKGRSS